MPITTIPIDDPSERASTGYRVVDGVEEAWRTFRVDTADPLEAVLDGVLPAIGSAYSVSAPGCVCVGYEPRVHTYGAGSVGATVVRVVYRSPRPGSSSPPAGLTVRYTTSVRWSRGTYRRLFRRSAAAGAVPIGGGDGIPCTYSAGAMDIYTYWLPASIPSLTTLNTMATKNVLNSNSVVTPPILSTGRTYTLAPRQAKYVEYAIGERGGLVEILHRLEISEVGWDVQVPVYDAVRRLASIETIPGIDQYEEMTFAGLW